MTRKLCPPSLDRRRFLGLAGAAVLAPGSLLALPGKRKAARPPAALPPPDGIATSRRRMIQMNGYPLDAETPLDALTTYLTPNDLFFVRHHWIPQYPSRKGWSLALDGEVDRALRISLEDLRRMPRTSVTCVLQCAGNGRGLFSPTLPGVQWRYGAVGNARWTGVSVKEILGRAGLKAGAKHLHAFGSDKPPVKTPPFHRSVELEKILADGIIADEMNGQPLPDLHGGPARLVVPGWAGDHWMKWLERLTVAAEPQKGFYMDTAYKYPKEPGAPGVMIPAADMRPVTELFVKSCITEAPAAARAGAPVKIGGFAFSGAPDVTKVEVTDDGGATWRAADLDSQHEPWSWRLWSFRWTPSVPGRQTIWVRATDSRGAVQPKEAVWNPSGYLHNGWHSASVEVTA